MHDREPGPRSRPLGLWRSTALVIGNMIGSGVFLLPTALAAYGGVSILGWLVTAGGAWVLALMFAGLARRQPGVGGPYAYTRDGLGRFAAFLVAWGYWLSLLAGNAAIAVAMVSYAAVFAPALGASPALGAGAAIGAVTLLTWVNVRSVTQVGQLQLLTTVAKLLPLLAVGLWGIAQLNPEHFVPFNRSGDSAFGALTATAALTLWAFLGLESATVPADEVENPTVTIPRATKLGVAIATVVYVLSTVAIMGLVEPGQLAISGAPFADAARVLWGDWAAFAVAGGAVVSCFGALNGWILSTGRIPAAAATDGLFPPYFARRSRYGTPVFALVFSSVLVCALVTMNYSRGLVGLFQFSILLSTMTVLVPYLFSAAAQWSLALKMRSAAGSGRLVWISVLAFAFSLWAIAGTGHEAVFWGVILLFCGLPVYAWMRASERSAGGDRTDPE